MEDAGVKMGKGSLILKHVKLGRVILGEVSYKSFEERVLKLHTRRRVLS